MTTYINNFPDPPTPTTNTTVTGSTLYIDGSPVGQVLDEATGTDGTVSVSVGPYVAEMNGWMSRIEGLPPTTTITLEELEQMKKEIAENREMIQRVLGDLKKAEKKLASSYDRKNPIDDLEV